MPDRLGDPQVGPPHTTTTHHDASRHLASSRAQEPPGSRRHARSNNHDDADGHLEHGRLVQPGGELDDVRDAPGTEPDDSPDNEVEQSYPPDDPEVDEHDLAPVHEEPRPARRVFTEVTQGPDPASNQARQEAEERKREEKRDGEVPLLAVPVGDGEVGFAIITEEPATVVVNDVIGVVRERVTDH